MAWFTKITSLVQRTYDWLGRSFWFDIITKAILDPERVLRGDYFLEINLLSF